MTSSVTSDSEDEVCDWSQLVPKRAYVLRSPQGDELLSTYGGPGEADGSAVFFAHEPSGGGDGELTILPDDGWSVLRSLGDDD